MPFGAIKHDVLLSQGLLLQDVLMSSDVCGAASGTAATLDLTGDQFTYTVGYEDYTYQGYYFTNSILGTVTVQ